MIFYCFLLFLTGVVTGLALRQVSRKAGCAAEERDINITPDIRADMAVYRNQMAEIETGRKQGLLDEENAAEARLELARRLLAAEKNRRRQGVKRGERRLSGCF